MLKHWKKKLGVLAVSATMLATTAQAAAATDPVDVLLNGETLEFGALSPVIQDGSTFVPLEAALEALDISETAANPRTIGGEAYVPLRAVGEAAGYEVHWNDETRTVTLRRLADEQAVRGFLWEVSHNGDTVYLVGSMHLADDSFYPLPDAYERAFEDAEYLGLEIDVTRAADPEMQQLVLELGTYQDGTTLADHIPEALYAELGNILSQYEMETDALDMFKPWVVETTLATLKALQAGYQSEVGIDMYFAQKAIERGIPILELESYESQLQMFNGFSSSLQISNLQAALDGFDELGDAVDEMAAMWKSGDEAVLLEMIGPMMENEEYRKAMLTDRNIGMVEKIVEYLEDPEEADYLIVVGAAHFVGEDGIVKLLEEKGYTVTRK